MATQQILDSGLLLQLERAAPATVSPFLTVGEYSVMPMEHCTEDQVASLFAKICQRGNPVLGGRPVADLRLLGKAMYRKCQIEKTGTVAMCRGEPVAIGCGWDLALGGVWAGSGLEMPASLSAHAACGQACFESFEQRKRASTFFIAFYGVVVPHSVKLFGWLGYSQFYLADKLGFKDCFMYTLIPTLTKRGMLSEKDVVSQDTMAYTLNFADIPSDRAEVKAELEAIGGTINVSLSSMAYIMSPHHKKTSAGVVGMTSDEMCGPAELIGTNHFNWLQSQFSGPIISRL